MTPAATLREPNPKIVALGGGHGLYTMLTALRTVTTDLTAVVTVADDGGSSGRIRREFDVLPPGDLRMALAALSGTSDQDQDWAELYQHRLGGTGVLAGHSVGNLVLTGLFERMGDPVAALDFLGRSLGSVGRVLPMSEVPLDLVATIEPHDRDDPVRGRRIRGQSAIASSPGRVREIAIRPADAPACLAATDAVRAADVVVLGPGSWFTSVLPHLLLSEMARAVVETRGRVVVTLNLVPQPGETDGFSPAEYLHVLRRYCPDLRVDAVISDENHSTSSSDASDRGSVELTRAAAGLGAVLILADLCEPDRDDRHRPEALAAAMRLALERAPGPAGRNDAARNDTDVIYRDLTKPDVIEPDVIEPDLAKPDLAKPDVAKPDLAKPDLAKPDLATPDLTEPAPRPAPGTQRPADDLAGGPADDGNDDFVDDGERNTGMAMTAAVKDELSRVTVTRISARKAEIATMLRFAGALHLIGGHIVIEAELDTGSVARRLRKEIGDVFGHASQVHVVAAGGLRKSSRFLVRVTKDGEGLARQAGLVDLRGRPVRGLPQHVVAGGVADAEAAWRGAFLAHGSLTEPGRAGSLEITCPSGEAALALVGAGRRLGISAKAREVRGADRVVIRDGDAIGALLTRLGAHETVLAWEERRMRREVRATANRLANFDDANLRRSARAAVAAGARVERAMDILADSIPEHLQQAGRLRIEHKQASLEELGALSDPPMTKDAIAGRIRRLLAMADKRASELGIPNTEAAVTADMLAADDE